MTILNDKFRYAICPHYRSRYDFILEQQIECIICEFINRVDHLNIQLPADQYYELDRPNRIVISNARNSVQNGLNDILSEYGIHIDNIYSQALISYTVDINTGIVKFSVNYNILRYCLDNRWVESPTKPRADYIVEGF